MPILVQQLNHDTVNLEHEGMGLPDPASVSCVLIECYPNVKTTQVQAWVWRAPTFYKYTQPVWSYYEYTKGHKILSL